MPSKQGCANIAILLLVCAVSIRADVITEAATRTTALIAASGIPTPTGNRALAMSQTAVYEAVNAITNKYPRGYRLPARPDASIEAAVAAANRVILLSLIPAKKAEIEADFQRAAAGVRDGPAKIAGLRLGEQAADAVLQYRSTDNASMIESIRPTTQPGVYVPTAIPVFSTWGRRVPWVMASADQFRPGPPPDLRSDTWARDYNEIKSMGVKSGSKRTDEQTAIAKFWETTGITVYVPVILSVANGQSREVTRNARLLAMASQAIDDALVSVFDAKYAYNFWRPVTAVRNGDNDGNEATERDASWVPFIDTPMHPEYPCAHCIVASTVGTVLRLELGNEPVATLSSVSPTLPGVTRRWATIDEFVREVSEGRIFDGVHYRSSTEVANAMGKKIGELVFSKFPPPR